MTDHVDRATTTTPAPGILGRLRKLGSLRVSGLIWVLLLMVLIAVIYKPTFINPSNLVSVARQTALFGIVAIGMTMVILTAGIDLSVGSVVAVAGVVCATMLDAGMPVWSVVIVGLVIGASLGAINGAVIVIGRVPPFIMTLGMMVIGRGLAMTISGGHPVHFREAADSFSWLGQGFLLGLPVPVWVFLLVAASAFFVLRYTPFGRNIYAVGSNPEAARLSGINVGFTIFSVYLVSGVLAGLTALIMISRLTVGEPVLATGLELEAIAMTVIGGTSLFGGEGGVIGTILGAAIVTVLANMLNLFGVSPFTQQIVKGFIIVAAVLFETYRRNRNSAK
jgi:ribose/xylose/arabinose/galactoside ABC-type transport system permease subunit